MYNLPHYKEQDQGRVIRFMKDHPFGMLIGVSADGLPVATQVPFLFDERNGSLFLLGHLMKGTDHHKAFEVNPGALAVFTGPHTYVSASWYSNPQQGSTWNYMTVHAKGQMHFLGEQELISVLDRLTTTFEENGSAGSFANIPADYISRMTKAIVAFEIEVKTVEHVFKLSQNRDEESYSNIISRLREGSADAQAIAEEMQQRKNQLFTV